MPSSEFILNPRIDEAKLRQENKKFNDVMKKSAQQIEDELKESTENGIKGGIKTGVGKSKHEFEKMGSWLQLASANLVANLATKAIETAVDKVTLAFQGAQEFSQLGRDRLSQIANVADNADALGIDRGRYAALTAMGKSVRLEENDMAQLLSGFVGALGHDEMKEFKDVSESKGIEVAFLEFIDTMSKKNPAQAIQLMNDQLGDSDSLLAARFMEPFQKLAQSGDKLTFSNIIKTMLGQDVDVDKLGNAVDTGLQRAKEIAKSDAQQMISEIYQGVSQGQTQAIIQLNKKTKELEQAHLDALEMKVDMEIKFINAEIGMVNKTRAAWEALQDYLNSPTEPSEESAFEKRARYAKEAKNEVSYDRDPYKAMAEELLNKPKVENHEEQSNPYAMLAKERQKEASANSNNHVEKINGLNSEMAKMLKEIKMYQSSRLDVGPQSMK
ncbi:hypothetical protein AL471_014390 [Vibrio alginolyticus]|uniref:hypothetical protein n=1 Tax=Vibrio alginolyticus TaxID=663 RepID=UPI00076CB31E|nr:hypothetical protein [Vibrio alginolyticus]PNP21961.1 hypothetical protein AL471_014390 [Vibrio alginolyticus]